jgi:hypothetical protein
MNANITGGWKAGSNRAGVSLLNREKRLDPFRTELDTKASEMGCRQRGRHHVTQWTREEHARAMPDFHLALIGIIIGFVRWYTEEA